MRKRVIAETAPGEEELADQVIRIKANDVESGLAALKSCALPALSRAESLQRYYAEWFPATVLAQWLAGRPGAEGEDLLSRREFSCEADDGSGGEKRIRYLAYQDAAGLRADFLRLLPLRYDIGPVYDASPRDRYRRINKLEPVERELVFDVDLDVYESVSALGQSEPAGAAANFADDPLRACADNWLFVEAAVTVMEQALREDFGYEHVLWVFSGRRGVHAWVCDTRARQLTDEARAAIVEYLQYRGISAVSNRSSLSSTFNRTATTFLHPALRRAATILLPFMDRFLEERPSIWADEGAMDTVLGMCPDAQVRETLRRFIQRSHTRESAAAVWRLALEQLDSKRLDTDAAMHIVLGLLYPRLDVNVTRQRNHLLKGPFSIHPKTNAICVPFRADLVSKFRPERDVPRLVPLVTGDAKAQKQLRAALDIMEAFVTELYHADT